MKTRMFLVTILVLILSTPAVARLGDDNWFTVYNQNYEGQDSNWLLHFKVTQERSVLSKVGAHVSYGVTSFMDQGAESSPIKEITHEPKVFFRNTSLLPANFTRADVGWWHRSNGSGPGPINRSYERGFADLAYTIPIEFAGVVVSIEATGWWIFDEAPENADIREWEGLSGRFGGEATIVLDRQGVGRYVFKVGPSSYSIDWHVNTVPFVDGLDTFLRLYDGAGESLVGYDQDSLSLGVGVSLREDDQ